MPKQWHNNGEADLKLYVVLLRNDGFSDAAIGEFFGATKGTCVGFRHRKLPTFIDIPRATKNVVPEARFRELREDHKALSEARAIISENRGVKSPYVGHERVSKGKGSAGKKAKKAKKPASRRRPMEKPEPKLEPSAPHPPSEEATAEAAPAEEESGEESFLREISRAADKTELEERPPAKPTVQRPEPEPPKAEQAGKPGCKWPTGTGGSLKKPELCGEDVVPGHDLCEEHLALVNKLRRVR